MLSLDRVEHKPFSPNSREYRYSFETLTHEYYKSNSYFFFPPKVSLSSSSVLEPLLQSSACLFSHVLGLQTYTDISCKPTGDLMPEVSRKGKDIKHFQSSFVSIITMNFIMFHLNYIWKLWLKIKILFDNKGNSCGNNF